MGIKIKKVIDYVNLRSSVPALARTRINLISRSAAATKPMEYNDDEYFETIVVAAAEVLGTTPAEILQAVDEVLSKHQLQVKVRKIE